MHSGIVIQVSNLVASSWILSHGKRLLLEYLFEGKEINIMDGEQ